MTLLALPHDLGPFGVEHFGAARLGDRRRTRSLVDLANRFAKHPGGSLPQKCRDPNTLRRCYDLMNNPQVSHAAVLQPHSQHTLQRVYQHRGVVLFLHDATELDLSGHTTLHAELGQIGTGGRLGYLCHNSLAVVPDDQRTVLGLVGQVLHVRDHVPPDETRKHKRERESRESLLWLKGVEGVQAATTRCLRRLRWPEHPEGLRVVDVCDCAADTFEFLWFQQQHQREYVIRSNQNRGIRRGHLDTGPEDLLHDYLRTLPARGSRVIQIHAHENQPAREATVAVAWAAVTLLVPETKNGNYPNQPLKVWGLRVWETAAPAGVDEPVEWFLLVPVAVTALADAWRRVDWYVRRWVVEEFHKAQKTGCDIEGPQFETGAALQPMVALLSVIAVHLLTLRQWSRDPALAGQAATEVVEPDFVEVLSAWRWGSVRVLTVREFFLALARLGGHQNRQGDKSPGWLVLWRGWESLQSMVEGVRAVRRAARAGKRAKSSLPNSG
jgi:hypothetical protein